MKRTALIVILFIVLTLSCFALTACDDYPEPSEGLAYSLSDDGKSYVVTGIGECQETDIVIPSRYKGKKVSTIAVGAFRYSPTLTSIVIGKNVTRIKNSAFLGCEQLQSIKLGDNLVSIDYRAFVGCYNLTSVTIPASVESVGVEAFEYCTRLQTLIIEDESKLTNIGAGAFERCDIDRVDIADLTAWNEIEFEDAYSNPLASGGDLYLDGQIVKELVIPEGITNINSYAFAFCHNITSIVVPNTVTSIGKGAFRLCTNIESITLPFVGETSDGGDNTYFEYIFGASKYSDSTFKSPASLKKVIITGGTKIGAYAFFGCNDVQTISIPSCVTSIESGAFHGCTGLQKVEIEDLTSWCKIAFGSNDANPLAYAQHLYIDGTEVKQLNIPSDITSIGDYSFDNCSGIEKITLPSGLKTIGVRAFTGTSISAMTIPDGVTEIGASAFYECENLESITIPNSVTTIGEGAFWGCSSLDNVILPEGIKVIEDNLFSNCASLSNIIIPQGVESIGDGAFYECKNLSSVTIPEGVVRIGEAAFAGSGIRNITIPSTVKYIGRCAFIGCRRLDEKIIIPASVTYIGDNAFYNCIQLESIQFEDPYGWYYSGTGISLTLTDVSQNANYLKDTYRDYAWYKTNNN